MTGLLTQYLGRGPLADRPESPVIADGTLALYQDDTGIVYSWDPIQEAWEIFGGTEEAPKDGKPYLRLNGEWVEYVEPEPPVIPDVPVQEAPEDGESYMRKDGEWFKYVPPVIPELPDNLVTEAPEDGDQYVRSDGAWEKVVIPEGEGFPEAPQDGKIYGRKNGAWAEVVSSGGGGVSPETPGQMAHKYWRVYCRANNGDGYTGLTEVYFRDAAGVEFPPTDGVIIKSGEAPNGAIGTAVQAFDRNVTNRWEVPVPVGAWIGIQYAAAVKVRRLSLTSGNQYPAQMMKNFDIQWSDDGVTWTTRWSQDNVTAWGTSETRNFADPVEDPVSTAIPSPTGKVGKVLTVAPSGRELAWSDLASRWCYGNGERRSILFCTSIGAGGGSPQNLLSGVAGNYFWFASGADATRDLRVDFGVPNVLQGWSMMMDGTDANGIWTVEGSNDQATWTPIINDYRLGGIGYGPGVLPVSGAIYTRDFANDKAFRYWRIRLNAGQASTQNRYITFLGFKCQPL